MLRLLALAAPLGPDVFRAVICTDGEQTACPHLSCAWCDDGDGEIALTLDVYGAGETEPKVLHDALLADDDGDSTASDAFNTLRDAMQRLQPPAAASRRRPPIGVHLQLNPSDRDVCPAYIEHVDQLLQACGAAAAAAAADDDDGAVNASGVRVLDLHVRQLYQGDRADPHAVAALVKAVLRYPIPVSLEGPSRRCLTSRG
ncbi:hypothetical protein P43SY_011068 [Pythium insidiosum]|uniref:Uncharacterized protein n=1 Tax=Pythium insidiosum TaxID=114742 RepID=A0AAD5LPG4_PYTIN|nr:hypothetical protein P43SY_011068 [Pythium insidiosum]